MAAPFSIDEEVTLTIDRLSYDGGRGVSRYQGFVVFVPDVAPQESVRARITNIKKNFAEAELINVVVPSPARRDPPCPVVHRCGGCPWQHITYIEQLRQKQLLLAHQLRKLLPDHLRSPEILPAPNEFHYRNRVQIHAKMRNPNIVEYGFFAKGSNDIVSIESCLISDPSLFEGLSDELIALNRSSRPALFENKSHKPIKIELALDSEGKRSIRPLHMQESQFTQVNSQQNLILQKIIVDWLYTHGPQGLSGLKIFDLYCGSGNLTLPISKNFAGSEIVGVEYSPSAITRAKSFAEDSGAKIHFVSQDVGEFLSTATPQPNTVMILDPPRAGLDLRVREHILRLQPDLILYVSCSLPTLARDLSSLFGQNHPSSSHPKYEVVNLVGLDMFPQTEYLETITALKLHTAARQ